MPCIASGCSGLAVRAVTNVSMSDFSFIWSDVTSHRFRHRSGSTRCHLSTSGHNASNICDDVGAVMTHFIGARVLANHTTAHAAKHVLPTPCAERMEMRV